MFPPPVFPRPEPPAAPPAAQWPPADWAPPQVGGDDAGSQAEPAPESGSGRASGPDLGNGSAPTEMPGGWPDPGRPTTGAPVELPSPES